jgi:hypothetical protein
LGRFDNQVRAIFTHGYLIGLALTYKLCSQKALRCIRIPIYCHSPIGDAFIQLLQVSLLGWCLRATIGPFGISISSQIQSGVQTEGHKSIAPLIYSY